MGTESRQVVTRQGEQGIEPLLTGTGFLEGRQECSRTRGGENILEPDRGGGRNDLEPDRGHGGNVLEPDRGSGKNVLELDRGRGGNILEPEAAAGIF